MRIYYCKYSIPELSNLEEIKKADDTAPIIPIMIQNDHLLMSSPEINIPEELNRDPINQRYINHINTFVICHYRP